MLIVYSFWLGLVVVISFHSMYFIPGVEWPVGQFRWMPEGPAAQKEKVCESMETLDIIYILPPLPFVIHWT